MRDVDPDSIQVRVVRPHLEVQSARCDPREKFPQGLIQRTAHPALPDLRIDDEKILSQEILDTQRLIGDLAHPDRLFRPFGGGGALGPARQLFEMPPAQRRTPVLLDFGDVKQVEVTLTWPEGWQVESGPVAFERATQAGSALYQVETDPAERTFKLTRRMEINKELYVNSQEYASLRELFELMERQDAKPLVLVRR